MSAAYEAFRALHHRPGAFIMPNPRDGASALLLTRAGFQALATTSLGIAFALGRPDGTAEISRAEAIANAELVIRLTGLPVNGDLEDGFGPSPEDCVATVEASVAAGLAGLGIEDTTANPAAPIHDFDHAVARIRAAAKAARGRILLTARTDNFLQGRPDLDDTIRRLVAFAECGAEALYAPGLPDMDAIEKVARAVAPVPLNVVFGPRSGPVPLAALAAAGVRRVSLGGALYRHAMGALVQAADRLRAGEFDFMGGAVTSREVTALVTASRSGQEGKRTS
jgi:2-methylisocitrate lyase-like PEP mutase family enzyme